jgi:hypothetical protein
MVLLGNILIILAALITLGLYSIIFGRKPGGDALVGYAWSVIILSLLFVITMILSSVIVGAKGGYEWISPNKSSRFWIVTIGIVSAILTAAMAAVLKGEGGPVPSFFRTTGDFIVIVIPVILLYSYIVLLNPSIRSTIPSVLYKWPLLFAFGLGMIGVTAAIGSYVTSSVRNQAQAIVNAQKRDDENIQRMLGEIATNDVSKNMVFLLVFTDGNQDATVREKAIERIYSNPQWREEMVRYLNSDWAPEAFTFFASNEVPDMEYFKPHIGTGILNQARLIRESIRRSSHPSHFYEGKFGWEVERVIRTADRFALIGGSYLSEMKELRAAFNEPSDFDKPKFRVIDLLDQWIEEHS